MNFLLVAILIVGVHSKHPAHSKSLAPVRHSESAAKPFTPVNADSLRRDVAALSSQGELDSALALAKKSIGGLPPATANLLLGKLELQGEASRKNFEAVSKDSSTASTFVRSEALFRLGQYHYAAGNYQLAVPQFREYLKQDPRGAASHAVLYWMAHACLQLAQQQAAKKSYLDSGLHYVELLEIRSRPNGYYMPLALNIKSRLLIARGQTSDTITALAALRESRARIPSEELPGNLLLSSRAAKIANPEAARKWEDSVLWDFPSSLEAALLSAPAPIVNPGSPKSLHDSVLAPFPSPVPSPKSARFTLRLGVFSKEKNAEEMRKRLSRKNIHVRVEEVNLGKNRTYRVLSGNYPDSATAKKEGIRIFKPLSYPFQVLSLKP